ncbi:putative small auxin-up RNA [Dioscorea sansibarensis]
MYGYNFSCGKHINSFHINLSFLVLQRDKSEMAKTWQKMASLRRKISSPWAINEHSDFNRCSTSSVPEKGYFFVYTSEGKWFMIPLVYLDNVIFEKLLKISEEEFGLPGDGLIMLPCDAASMVYMLPMLRRGTSQEVEQALISTIFISCQSTCYSLTVEHAPQLTVCSF